MICWNNFLTLMNMSKRVVMRINNKRIVSSTCLEIRSLTCYTGLVHHIAYMNKIQNVQFYAQTLFYYNR